MPISLREKPGMTWEHNDSRCELAFELRSHIAVDAYRVHVNMGRTRMSSTQYYIPDVIVIPVAVARRLFTEPGMLEAYPEALPFVVEAWSPSTGTYDVSGKLPNYRRGGDRSMWYLHPYRRTLTVWDRQPDGSYTETIDTGGSVAVASLPGVTVDLDALLDRMRP